MSPSSRQKNPVPVCSRADHRSPSQVNDVHAEHAVPSRKKAKYAEVERSDEEAGGEGGFESGKEVGEEVGGKEGEGKALENVGGRHELENEEGVEKEGGDQQHFDSGDGVGQGGGRVGRVGRVGRRVGIGCSWIGCWFRSRGFEGGVEAIVRDGHERA